MPLRTSINVNDDFNQMMPTMSLEEWLSPSLSSRVSPVNVLDQEIGPYKEVAQITTRSAEPISIEPSVCEPPEPPNVHSSQCSTMFTAQSSITFEATDTQDYEALADAQEIAEQPTQYPLSLSEAGVEQSTPQSGTLKLFCCISCSNVNQLFFVLRVFT